MRYVKFTIPEISKQNIDRRRHLQSVANLTRQDAREFLEIAARTPIKTHVEAVLLLEANTALNRWCFGNVINALAHVS
jgi:propanol-preferring alcohol dehydrogenase